MFVWKYIDVNEFMVLYGPIVYLCTYLIIKMIEYSISFT